MRTIIINSSNYVIGSGNQYTYNFPSTVHFDTEDAVGIASCSIYNSTFNITSTLANNTITFKWNANTSTTFTFTIPDSYMSVSDLNFFLQQQMILNNLYVTNASSQNVYFAEFIVNAPRYAVSLNIYPLPTSAQATTLGYTIPSGATWSFPTSASCPQLTLTSAFGALIGYIAGTYPATSSTSTTQNLVSSLTPNLNVVDSYILTCSLLSSPYSIPNDSFFTIPLTGALGSLIAVNPSQIVFNSISPNSYQSITIRFFDQNFKILLMNDHQLTLTLAILDKNDRANSKKM